MNGTCDNLKLFDHGYVNLVEAWGSDESIIEAARMSTGGGFKGWGKRCVDCGGDGFMGESLTDHVCPTCKGTGKSSIGDEKLLKYLWDNKHSTPFEMAGATFEVQAPIFVFREWHRHRTQSYNEASARYGPLPDLNYLPELDRLMMVSKTNKQAGVIKGADELTEDAAKNFLVDVRGLYERAEGIYKEALQAGVPKELARIVLPVGRYSRMRASANLRNWLGFLTLRLDEAAQHEIRMYARAVESMLMDQFPRTMELFRDTPDE